MTPTPRDTGPALDPRAVEAAAEAIHSHWGGSDYFADDLSTRALTAAAPFLLAAERQRIAEAIRSQALYVAPSEHADGMLSAARIAEGMDD